MRALATAVLLACGVLGASWVDATAGEPSRVARGVFVDYDRDSGNVTVRERGVQRTYVLRDDDEARTRVIIEGNEVGPERLEAGSPIVISWRPDPVDASRRQALELEVPKIPKSFREELR